MRRWLAFVFAMVVVAPVASAATIERLVMPGPVIAGHADLENECSNCHKAFVAGEQTALCLDCHEEIAADVKSKQGFHGWFAKQTPDLVCKTCHTEHKGRDADIVGLNPNAFDHGHTDFPLRGSHVGVDCAACHESDKAFRDAPSACVACHGKEQPHMERLGDDCAGCHSEERQWPDVVFDHSTTDFPLRGAHTDVTCAACHVDEVWDGLPQTCVSCHSRDDVHRGTRGTDCGKCHTNTDWSGAKFDHKAETGFALLGRHADLACSACHLDGMKLKKPPKDCVGCHSADDAHRGRFGTDCGACHGVTTWKNEYDHLAETGYALLGAHETLACESCHKGALTDPLPKTCVGCHEDDDPHNGSYTVCDSCHTVTSWHEVTFDHGFTNFPLIGIHTSAACEACHTDLNFTDVSHVCGDCHADRDFHKGAFGSDCGMCHNPNGWDRWQFDHDTQTTYPLTGAHKGLECAGCHKTIMVEQITLSRACIACHADDDVHNGQFGSDCDRCHTTESFRNTKLFGKSGGL